MRQLLTWIALVNHERPASIIEKFERNRALEWHFKGPLACKASNARFEWLSLLRLHYISSKKCQQMADSEITL